MAAKRPRTAHRTFYEFFAGGGMATAGFGEGWICLFANDFDPMKGRTYVANWGDGHLKIGDVGKLKVCDLPGTADLAWASFPCQDLSLAGMGAGLSGARSSTFWPFWNLMRDLAAEGRAPQVIILENVYGAITSHGGQDFRAISEALATGGYRFGALVVDAVHFVPQSRPRLFIVAVRDDAVVPKELLATEPVPEWTPAALVRATELLSKETAAKLVWWRLPVPPASSTVLSDLIEDVPTGVEWDTPKKTAALLAMMADGHKKKVAEAKRLSVATGTMVVGTVYKRTRPDAQGNKIQRAEVRFDNIAGCLRTPGGGSSRQTILVVDGKKVRSRLLSPREAARLMGLPDSYQLPDRYNDAYHVAGDGVAVPVVRYLVKKIAERILNAS